MSRTHYTWDELIPKEETLAAVRFMVDIWNRASSAYKDHFAFSQIEPKLTERLYLNLMENEADSGLSGFWQNEPQVPLLDENGKLIRIRKDIVYQSNRDVNRRLDLTFEFKKVTVGNKSTYQSENGMRRFVDGNYAKQQPLAFMVGVIKPEDTEAIDALLQSLGKSSTQKTLQMVCDSDDRYVFRPSGILPDVVEFDTEHRRSPDKAPLCGNIRLGHIFLDCPI